MKDELQRVFAPPAVRTSNRRISRRVSLAQARAHSASTQRKSTTRARAREHRSYPPGLAARIAPGSSALLPERSSKKGAAGSAGHRCGQLVLCRASSRGGSRRRRPKRGARGRGHGMCVCVCLRAQSPDALSARSAGRAQSHIEPLLRRPRGGCEPWAALGQQSPHNRHETARAATATETALVALQGAVWCLAASLLIACPALCAWIHAREAERKAKEPQTQLAQQLEQAREAAAYNWGQALQRQDAAATTQREQPPRRLWDDYDPDAPEFKRNPRAIEVRRRKFGHRNLASEEPSAEPRWTRTIPPPNPTRREEAQEAEERPDRGRPDPGRHMEAQRERGSGMLFQTMIDISNEWDDSDRKGKKQEDDSDRKPDDEGVVHHATAIDTRAYEADQGADDGEEAGHLGGTVWSKGPTPTSNTSTGTDRQARNGNERRSKSLWAASTRPRCRRSGWRS